MGDWFKQIFLQGLVIGVLAALLAYVPWAWAKIILFVLLAYVVLMMGRNPLFFYRQIIRALALGSVLVLGISGQFAGRVALPEEWGALDYAIEIGGAEAGWFVLALAIMVAADFGFAWIQERKTRHLVGAIAFDVRVQSASAQGISIHHSFTLTGARESVTLTGAKIKVGAFSKPDFITVLLRALADGPEQEVEDKVMVQLGQECRLAIDAEAKKGLASALLALRLHPTPRWIFPVRGRLELLRGIQEPIVIPVRLFR